MPEAVIVATARSPIGRAAKGSLRDLRPDDLATTIIDAALAKVPQLDRTLIEDLYLGCGLPGGEQGFNMGRVVAATIIDAALAKVPQLDRTLIEDLYLGCGLPGGEQGFNMGRVVATLLGLDGLPGATVTRYCSSSLQTTRMAFHAIKAGEGDIFVSAGVETVSRYARGSSDGLPSEAQALVGGGWENPKYDEARARTAKYAEGGQTWHD